jgi:neutral trehalase
VYVPGLAKSKNSATLTQGLYRSGLLSQGGILTTKVRGSGQQWDAPNAWAPLVLLTIEGLVQTQLPAAIYLAVSQSLLLLIFRSEIHFWLYSE